jgi:hypothetical protein
VELNHTTWDNYQSAKWQVQFVLHMLDMPAGAKMNTQGDITEELADYAERLKIARSALSEFPAEWAEVANPRFNS